MHKIKLKYLLSIYKYEIMNGNYKHVKDLIAIMVMLDLSYIIPVYDLYNLNEITLDTLYENYNYDTKFKVPDMNSLGILKEKYYKLLSKKKIPMGVEKHYAAITWLELMLEFNFINEGDDINLHDYRLTDFIDDEKLINLFKDSGYINSKYNNKFNRILKK